MIQRLEGTERAIDGWKQEELITAGADYQPQKKP